MANLENLLADTRYWADQGGDPSAPSAGEPVAYTKSGLLYVRNSSGIVGPLIDETMHDALDHTGLTGVGGGSGASVIVSAGSSVSSTSFADTDMAIAVAANTDYRILAGIGFNTNATSVGIRLAFNGPASPTLLKIGGHVPTGGAGTNDSTIGHTGVTAYDTPIVVTTSGPGLTNGYAIIMGIFRNGANAGTLTLRHASETATATSIESGSFLELLSF